MPEPPTVLQDWGSMVEVIRRMSDSSVVCPFRLFQLASACEVSAPEGLPTAWPPERESGVWIGEGAPPGALLPLPLPLLSHGCTSHCSVFNLTVSSLNIFLYKLLTFQLNLMDYI